MNSYFQIWQNINFYFQVQYLYSHSLIRINTVVWVQLLQRLRVKLSQFKAQG